MEELVLQKLVREIYIDLQNIILEGGDFTALEDVLKKDLDELGRKLLQEAVACVDAAIMSSDERKKDWNVKRSRKKEIKTIFGTVDLERTYYQHKRSKRYSYLCDVYLGLEKYQRLSKKTKHYLIEKACDVSYAKAAEPIGLTAETTRNILNEIKVEDLRKNPKSGEQRKVGTIFVGADEDHIAIRGKGGKQQYLIYVYDGIKDMNGRRELENIHYFTRKQGNTEQLWLEVAEYIYSAYDTEELKKIFLMGDGASWIKQGLDWLPQSVFVLDKWHLSKYIRTACAVYDPYFEEYFFNEVWGSIWQGDQERLKTAIQRMLQIAKDKIQKEKIRKMRDYILNNWDGVRNLCRMNGYGCSAEAHISHMLSARLSSRPMVWSEDGADKIASLRTFRKNGGDITQLELKSRGKRISAATLSSRMKREVTKNINEFYYDRQFTIPILHSSNEAELKSTIYELLRYKL